MDFKEFLRSKLDEKNMRPAELARLSGVTKQNISRILTNKPHPLTNAAPTVTPATVEKIAKALGVDVKEARLAAAGFTSTNGYSGILEGFDSLSQEDQEIAARQIRSIIDAFLSKGRLVEKPGTPIKNEEVQRKVA